jgi:hypothetical protein
MPDSMRRISKNVCDSELLGILGHINKISVPDHYEAAVRESDRRGLIGKAVDDMRLAEWQHDRSTRKLNPGGHIKRTIILVLSVCVLSAIPFGIGIWHGEK